jgi:hypothetical protein
VVASLYTTLRLDFARFRQRDIVCIGISNLDNYRLGCKELRCQSSTIIARIYTLNIDREVKILPFFKCDLRHE